MVDLTLTAGAITATVTASNVRADRIITGFVEWAGRDTSAMSAQEKADTFMELIVGYATKKARQHVQEAQYGVKRAEADADLEADPVEWM